MTDRDIHSLSIAGDPVPQGSKTGIARGGKVVVLEGKTTNARQRHRDWREAIAWTANREAMARGGQAFGDGVSPVLVVAAFHVRKPKGIAKRFRWSARKPDLDKLLRALHDGLAEGGLLAEDSRVAGIFAWKRYAVGRDPGVSVRLVALEEGDELSGSVVPLAGRPLQVAWTGSRELGASRSA